MLPGKGVEEAKRAPPNFLIPTNPQLECSHVVLEASITGIDFGHDRKNHEGLPINNNS